MDNKAIGYTRVSTEEQARDGVSLSAQAEKIRQLCALHDLELVEIAEDAGKSAKDMDRSGLKWVMETAKHGKVTIVVAKLDRLTRNVGDLQEILKVFDKSGARLMSAAESLDTQSAGGRLVINIMAVVSQWEREVIAERTRDGMRECRRLGKKTGGDPAYGWRYEGGVMVEIPIQQSVRRIIMGHHAKGNTSAWTADMLNTVGHTTARGKPWTYKQVQRVIKYAERREKENGTGQILPDQV